MRGDFAQPGATLSISGGQLPLHIQLQGSGSLPLAALGELKPNTSSDFGAVTLGTTQQRTFTFRNIGNQPATGVFYRASESTGLSVAGTPSCGTQVAPKTINAGGSCSVTLNFGGNEEAALNDAKLTLEGGFKNSPLVLGLTGTAGLFDVKGAWSSTSGSSTPIASHDYVTTTVGYSTPFTARLVHLGTYGPLSVGYRLVGDTEHFNIITVRRSTAMGGGCITGGTIATDKLSFTPCKSGALSGGVAGSSHQVEAVISYVPQSIGQHQVRVEPYSNNGSILPEALVLNGRGEFNPEGKWSTDNAIVTPLDSAYLDFGQKSVGSASSKTMFIMNTGTHGPISIGLRLSGDVSQFSISSGPVKSYGSITSGCGATLNTEKTETTPCLADNKTNYQHIKFGISYAPKTPGNHTLTITPYTNNGTILPAPITFQGTAQFDAAGQWSSAPGALTPYPNNIVDFGARTINKSATASDLKYLYLLNSGQFGKMAASFRIEGDISEFDIHSAPLMVGSTGVSGSCGASVVTGLKSTTTCTAQDAISPSSMKHIYVTIRHNPKTLGTHTARLIPISENGSQLPGELTLRGEGRFSPAAQWSSSYASVVALADANTKALNKAVGSQTNLATFLVNTGVYGPLNLGFKLTGDTEHFELVSVRNGSGYSCGSQSAVIHANKIETQTNCIVEDAYDSSKQASSILVTVRYKPTSQGAHTVTLTPSTMNGTALPEPLVFNGNAI